MIMREDVVLKPSHYACGETFTEVLTKDGLEIGTIWPCEDGSYDYESFITGMSWNTIGPEPIEDVIQHLIDVANEEPDEDYDGQPDEMQEWHDFDPDC